MGPWRSLSIKSFDSASISDPHAFIVNLHHQQWNCEPHHWHLTASSSLLDFLQPDLTAGVVAPSTAIMMKMLCGSMLFKWDHIGSGRTEWVDSCVTSRFRVFEDYWEHPYRSNIWLLLRCCKRCSPYRGNKVKNLHRKTGEMLQAARQWLTHRGWACPLRSSRSCCGATHWCLTWFFRPLWSLSCYRFPAMDSYFIAGVFNKLGGVETAVQVC